MGNAALTLEAAALDAGQASRRLLELRDIGYVLAAVGVFWLPFSVHPAWLNDGWPLLISIGGVALYVLGLMTNRIPESVAAEWLVVVGSIAFGVGLVLWYQAVTLHWATWAWLWPAAGPIPLGVGLLAYEWIRKGSAKRAGLILLAFGSVALILSTALFEGVIHLDFSPTRGVRFVFPGTMIVVGALIFGLAMRALRRSSGVIGKAKSEGDGAMSQ